MQRIHLDGLGRTKDDFVSQLVKRVFKATNFEEVKSITSFPSSSTIEFVSGKIEIRTKTHFKCVRLQLVLNLIALNVISSIAYNFSVTLILYCLLNFDLMINLKTDGSKGRGGQNADGTTWSFQESHSLHRHC